MTTLRALVDAIRTLLAVPFFWVAAKLVPRTALPQIATKVAEHLARQRE